MMVYIYSCDDKNINDAWDNEGINLGMNSKTVRILFDRGGIKMKVRMIKQNEILKLVT